MESRAIQIGVIATIFLHILMFWGATKIETLAPHNLVSGTETLGKYDNQPFSIELADNIFTAPKPPPDRFVETNPDAPVNEPDNTRNFGAQSQQAAQETPTPDGKSDTPASKGDEDKQSTAIVSGQLADPQPAQPPPAPDSGESEQMQSQKEETARLRETPDGNPTPVSGDSPDGYGGNAFKVSPNPTHSDKEVAGVENGQKDGTAQTTQSSVNPNRPRARPTLPSSVVRARPTFLLNNDYGTSNIGAAAYDAKWSNYGEYLQKLIESVQIQWERLLIESRVSPPRGTRVKVVFRLNSKGEVSAIVTSESNGGQQAEYACVNAITSRAPYGDWTDDMIAMLGQEQELTFTFYYQ